MSSIRKRLEVNANDSKNTRMDIAGAGYYGDFRADILAHMSRFSKIAQLMVEEAKRLGRPLSLLDIGCGGAFPIKVLYKAYVVRKAEIVKSYRGIDIDPVVLELEDEFATMMKTMNMSIDIQDLTVDPEIKLKRSSVDFFWTTEVIEHMKPEFIAPWLDEAHRVLKKGGLIYVSTPNHDGSNKKLPEDHVYEWGFEELKTELTKRWKLQEVTGTFIQIPKFRAANRKHGRIPQELVDAYTARFDGNWLRNVLAAPYPEYANNCAWILRK